MMHTYTHQCTYRYTHTHTHTANLLLQDTIERIHVGKQYGDIPRGIYLVRGENMALCGEIVCQPTPFCEAPPSTIFEPIILLSCKPHPFPQATPLFHREGRGVFSYTVYIILPCMYLKSCVTINCPLSSQDAALESAQPLEKVSIDTILEAQRVQQEGREAEKKRREQLLRSRGIRPLEHSEDTYS